MLTAHWCEIPLPLPNPLATPIYLLTAPTMLFFYDSFIFLGAREMSKD